MLTGGSEILLQQLIFSDGFLEKWKFQCNLSFANISIQFLFGTDDGYILLRDPKHFRVALEITITSLNFGPTSDRLRVPEK